MGIAKLIISAVVVIVAIFALVQLFPYVLTILAVVGAVKIYQEFKERRNDWRQ